MGYFRWEQIRAAGGIVFVVLQLAAQCQGLNSHESNRQHHADRWRRGRNRWSADLPGASRAVDRADLVHPASWSAGHQGWWSGGGLVGWWLGRTWRAAVATAVTGFVFVLGPGHNIPFIGGTLDSARSH